MELDSREALCMEYHGILLLIIYTLDGALCSNCSSPLSLSNLIGAEES